MRTILILAVLATSHVAVADDDDQLADAAQLQQAPDLAATCKTFDAALVASPNNIAITINVGVCAELADKPATAARHYVAARDLARAQHRTQLAVVAEDRLTAVTPRISHLAIGFVAAPAPGTQLTVDGAVVDVGVAADIALDAGVHDVVVATPGMLAFRTRVSLATAERLTIAVPSRPVPLDAGSNRRAIGKIITLSGAALAATGVGLGLYARSEYHTAIGGCIGSEPTVCDASGTAKVHRAQTLGNISTAVGLTGVAAITAGVITWLTAPDERRTAVVPVVAADGAGVAAVGRF
jgi:hypothetical protein